MNFKDDYSIGAHPLVLNEIIKANSGIENSYQQDHYSKQAAEKIKNLIGINEVLIRFVSGGTLANLLVIAAGLRPYEAVISAKQGHINLHETGAVEFTGHKIIPIETNEGKLSPQDIMNVLDDHNTPPHMVKPRMVYISNATEYGTIYTKAELEKISQVCKQHNLYLFMDGARLGAALTSDVNDMKMGDIARLTDVFYIGGTKNGGLMGEAIVIKHPAIQKDFDFHLKQKGALPAKSRFFGAQFLGLFKENLYFELAHKANIAALKLQEIIQYSGIKLKYPTQTNQVFPILTKKLVDRLSDQVDFYIWEKLDENNYVIRLVTSWQTSESEIMNFKTLLNKSK
jgi:threonine aldolase